MQKNQKGFTLIELLVVVAIMSLMASVGMIAYQQARIKSRNARRLGDMTQMNTSLEMYFSNYRGYPSGVNGQPASLAPDYIAVMPKAPSPPDDACTNLMHGAGCVGSDASCNNVLANTYFYVPVGTPYVGGNGVTVYPSYTYYFCLGDQTGDYPPGERALTPAGVR